MKRINETVYELEGPDLHPDDFDRRREARIRVEASVRVEARPGALSDLSLQGAFVQMPSPPEEGAVVEIEFNLPRSRGRTRAMAVVRWVRPETEGGPPAGCGVQFVWTPQDSQDEIRRALAG